MAPVFLLNDFLRVCIITCRLVLSKRLIIGVHTTNWNEHYLGGRFHSSGGEGLPWHLRLLHRYDANKQGKMAYGMMIDVHH